MPVYATPTNGAPQFSDVTTTNDVYGLIEKVGKQTFEAAQARNRLGIFDKGFLQYGTTIETTLVKAAESRAYNPNASSATTPITPALVTRYFNEWVERDYAVSVKDEDVRAVLTGGLTVGDLAASVLSSMDTGERRDDYHDMKAVLKQFANTYSRPEQKITLTEGDTLETLVELMRYVSKDMSFDNDKYAGIEGVQTETDMDKLVIVAPHGLINRIDVRVFAQLFNLGKADIVPEIVEIDSDDGLVYICDRDAFGTYTKFRDFHEQINGNARSKDYVLGVTKMFYYNPIYKAAVIDASILD